MKWEIASSVDREYIFAYAERLGWYEDRVQVKRIEGMDTTWWIIEPYEDCNCPSIVPPPKRS